MGPGEKWLAAIRPFVRDTLPAAPARVLEIGCGPLGGFVPELRVAGYRAMGVDPEAPEGDHYRRVVFECLGDERVDAILACTSLHHVAELGAVLDRAQAMLAPGGVLVVVDWLGELFDRDTATWCFDRLARDQSGWLRELETEWRASADPWDVYLRGWTERERIRGGYDLLRELDARFERRRLEYGAYFFAGLDGVSEVEEQAAIDAGLVRATRIQYAGSVH